MRMARAKEIRAVDYINAKNRLLLLRTELAFKAMNLALGLTEYGSEERTAEVKQEHQAIVEAIEARDAQAATVAMQAHIYQVRRRVLDCKKDL